MSATIIYLSREQVRDLAITPEEARMVVLAAFRDHAAGLNLSMPKVSIDIGPGRAFQSMSAASHTDRIAAVKWVTVAPVPAGSVARGIQGIVIVSDLGTGEPVALMDGDEITLIRTAAMSATAAAHMAPKAPETIGMIGCGEQAFAHLSAFQCLFPGLRNLLAFSRSRSSALRLVEAAQARGLRASSVTDADDLIGRSDIVISMVPATAGLVPFLDARLLPASSFVSAVDVGRSWLPESLPAFDRLVTDSLSQGSAPMGADGRPVTTARFDADLAEISTETPSSNARSHRSLFCFRGFALADLALTKLILTRARQRGIGTVLPR
ncbi:hypothetical protein [Shinella sp. M27]|uniref:hypothetical protein n=1 Tax=Shinella sp. M27 TaxID=3368614 RepID=UPI003BA20460